MRLPLISALALLSLLPAAIAEHSGTIVEFGDESIVFKPAFLLPPAPKDSAKAAPTATTIKTRAMMFPSVDLDGSTLEEARDFLCSRTQELDYDLPPNMKGINIRIPSEELPSCSHPLPPK